MSAAFAGDPGEIYSTPNGKFRIDLNYHIGYGIHIVNSEDFTPWNWHSDEFFINLIQFTLNPFEWGGLQAGIDFQTMAVRTKSHLFLQDANKRVLATNVPLVGYDDVSSTLRSNGFSAPILLKFNKGKFALGAGVNLQFNTWGKTIYTTEKDYVTNRTTMRKADFTPFTYSFMGTLSYDEFGVYFRYYPTRHSLVPEAAVSPSFGLMTVGVAIGF